MLYKGSSQTARFAVFGEPDTAHIEDIPVEAIAEPSREALEIARLSLENETLRRDLADLKSEWAEALAAAETRAREQAARDHESQEERRSAHLVAVTDQANVIFARFLDTAVEPAAIKLAIAAFSRLAAIRADDEDWIHRVTARRIAEIGSHSEVVLHVHPEAVDAPDPSDGGAGWPSGYRIVHDRSLSPGTASVRLKLGEILIDPREGAARIARLLGQDMTDA